MTESALDRIIYSVVTRHMDDGRLASYAQTIEQQQSLAMTSSFQAIDTKATGMLTHVSMMIAGLGLVAPLVANNNLELGVIIVEICAYLLIATGCLRCLSVHDLGAGVSVEQKLVRELILRRELYAWCNRASVIFTIIVFVLLPILFLWDPTK